MNISGANSKMQREFHSLGYTGKDCIIAVLDTAIGEVGKLKGKIEYADSYRIDDKNTEDHGTFVSGQIADWAPDAKILSYCVFPDGSGKCRQVTVALSDLLKRVRTDKSHHYFVNMSLASNLGKNVVTPYISNMHSLIQQLNAEGVPVFVAAGNDGTEELYIYPSRFQEPICVAAANTDGTRSNYSVWHDQIDFIEWGTGVCNINKNGLPIIMSGTSMACPNLLGKSILLACRMYDINGAWPTEMQLYQEMLNCAIDCETVGYDKHTGYGFVDIRKTDGIYKETDSFEIPVTWKNKLSETITIIKNLLQKQGVVLQDTVSDTPYSKIIKFGSTGNDVKKVKDKLVELGYLHASTKYTFGADSVVATKRFQAANNLKVDGIVGILTWNALFGEDQNATSSGNSDSSGDSSIWTRDLTVGSSGTDVKLAKDRLVELGYLSKSTHNTFGNDTKSAVIRLQANNSLSQTGIIDLATWTILFSEVVSVPETIDINDIPPNISRSKAKIIAEALANVSQVRKNIVLDALQYAVDPDNLPPYMYAFYGRGKNLYNNDLTLNIATKSAMDSYFNKSSYAPYYDGGRQEIMEEAAKESDYTLPWADCSGMIAGLLKKHCVSKSIDGVVKVVSSGFDSNANTFASNYSSEVTNHTPGNFLCKEGHIGLVVGSDLGVESAGGAYGFVLSNISSRKIYSFLDHKTHKFSDWTSVRQPVFYE